MSKNYPEDTVQWHESVFNELKDTLSMNTEHVANQGAKLTVVWVAWGITSWQDVAGFLAALLSFLALSEWVWKKIIRPLLVWRGLMKPTKRKMVEVDFDD